MDVDSRTIGLMFVVIGLLLLLLGYFYVLSWYIPQLHGMDSGGVRLDINFMTNNYIKWVPTVVSTSVGVVFVVIGRHRLIQKKLHKRLT